MGVKKLQHEERQKKVLAIDDEDEILTLYELFLKEQGFDITTVNSAEEAVEFLKTDQPDIILLDVNMPNVDGLRLLEILRVSDKTKNTPILMISARRDEDTITRAVEFGCDSFIIKPFKLKELVRRINAELVSVDLNFVYEALKKITQPQNSLLKHPGLKKFDSILWDSYPFKSNDFDFMLIVPRGARIYSLIKADAEELIQKVKVFYKQLAKWRQVWPEE